MRKQICAALIVLLTLLCGCSGNTADLIQTEEAIASTAMVTEEESASSPLSSDSIETPAPEETEITEGTATPETEVTEPPKEEIRSEKTTVEADVPKENENDTVQAPSATPAVTVAPEETSPPAETTPEPTPQSTPEETKPASAYDAPFDVAVIKADGIAIGQGMGLSLDSSLTPNNASWWNPVTASQANQGAALKQSLASYIRFHTVENLGSYGMDAITSFNIYCEARGNGVYSIYFHFA